jgi:hypothetical protein
MRTQLRRQTQGPDQRRPQSLCVRRFAWHSRSSSRSPSRHPTSLDLSDAANYPLPSQSPLGEQMRHSFYVLRDQPFATLFATMTLKGTTSAFLLEIAFTVNANAKDRGDFLKLVVKPSHLLLH